MIDISEALEGVLAGYSYSVFFRLQSWLDEECIAEDIPAIDVLEEQDASMRVPERLTFTVPLEEDAVSWVPTRFDSPLGCYGQRILAQVGIGLGGSSAVEWINRGVFLLESAETSDGAIHVECLGLTQLLDEAELAAEFQPTTGATYGETIRQLIEPGIVVNLENAPTDKTIRKSAVTWSDNRLDDVFTIMDAWPAQARITSNGYLAITTVPADPEGADVVFSFTDGTNGTVMEYSSTITRDGAYNCVIAEGQYDDDRGALAGMPIIHTALDTDPESPYNLFGSFSPYLVPFKFDSPLLNEHAETLLAATTRLRNLHLKASRTVQVQCVPHPALQLGDAVSVTSQRLDLGDALGRVDAFSFPYSAEGGGMDLTVRLKGFTSPHYVAPTPPVDLPLPGGSPGSTPSSPAPAEDSDTFSDTFGDIF